MEINFDSTVSKAFQDLAGAILVDGAYKATKYISEKLTIKASRKRFKGKIYKSDKAAEIVFIVGRPNYEEREFIKRIKKAKEPFPVKKLQLKFIKVK